MTRAALVNALQMDVPEQFVDNHIGYQRVSAELSIVTLSNVVRRNALSHSAWRRLGSLFGVLGDDEALRAVVIRGAGREAFAAGADISEFAELRSTAATAISYNAAIVAAFDGIQRLPVPVIAMISGMAIGGGCELAAACDVRIADTTCRIGIPIGRLGVILGYTEARILTRLIGAAELNYLLMSGEIVDSSEAHRIGFLQRVVAPGQLIPTVGKFVESVISSSRTTMRASKIITQMTGRDLEANDTETLARLTAEAYEGPDLAEGVAAFVSHRQPSFPHNDGGTRGIA